MDEAESSRNVDWGLPNWLAVVVGAGQRATNEVGCLSQDPKVRDGPGRRRDCCDRRVETS